MSVDEFILKFWPILATLGSVAMALIMFRAEVIVRLKILEEKVKTLFELHNKDR